MRSSLQRSLSHLLIVAIIASVALIAPLSPIASSSASAATAPLRYLSQQSVDIAGARGAFPPTTNGQYVFVAQQRKDDTIPAQIVQLRKSDLSRVKSWDVPCGEVCIEAMTADSQSLWAVSAAGDLYQFDIATGTLTRTIKTKFSRCDYCTNQIAADGTSLWMTNRAEGTLTQYNASTGSLIRVITVGTYPQSISVAGGSVWVANWGGTTVTQLSAVDGSLIKNVAIGSSPWGVAAQGSQLWVLNRTGYGPWTVKVFDTDSGALLFTNTAQIGWARGVVLDEEHAYFNNVDLSSITVYNRSDAKPLQTASPGWCPASMASDGHLIFTANCGDGRLSRFEWKDVVAPQAPIAVFASATDSTDTEVSWDQPRGEAGTGGGSITAYKVSVVGTPTLGCTADFATTYCRVKNLTVGTSYRFSVSATNAVGTSPDSSPSPVFVPVASPTPSIFLNKPTLLPTATPQWGTDSVVANGHVWVVNPAANSLFVYDEVGPSLIRSVPITSPSSSTQGAIASNGQSVFVLGDGVITEVDEPSGVVLRVLEYPGATGITVSGNRLWVLNRNKREVTVRELEGSALADAVVSVGTWPRTIISDASNVWISNEDESTVTQINSQTRSVVRTIALSGMPRWLASNGTTLWVLHASSKWFLSAIDVATGAVRTRVSQGVAELNDLAMNGNYLYLAGTAWNGVSVLDATTGAWLGSTTGWDGLFHPYSVSGATSDGAWVLSEGTYGVPTLSRLTFFSPRTPNPPTGVLATPATNGATEVNWVPLTGTEATGGRSIISYNVTAVDEPGVGCTTNSDASFCTISNLTIGRSYRFIVTATNSIGTGDSSRPSPVFVPSQPPTAQARIVAADTQVTGGTCPICGGNDSLEVNGHLWIAYSWESSVLEYDLNGMALLRRVSGVSGGAEGGAQMATDGKSVFVRGDNVVTQIDEATGSIVKVYSSALNGRSAYGITATNGLLWILDRNAQKVIAVNPVDFSEVYVVPVGSGPQSIASDSRFVWTSNYDAQTITQINAASGSVVRTIEVGGHPDFLASNGTMVWTLSWGTWAHRNLTGIDVASGSVVARVGQGLPFWTRDIAVDGTQVYVVNDCYSGVGIFDATTGQWIGTKSAEGLFCPNSVSAGAGGAWVTSSGAVNGGAGGSGTVTQLSVYNPRINVAPADRAVVASWSGMGADHYEVSSPDGSGRSCVTTESSCRITGLTNGVSYNLVLKAYDASGTLVETLNSSAVTPAGLPGVATNVFATSASTTATVTFSAAPSNGASVSYVVTASPGGGTCATSSTSCTFTGLVNDTPYTFSVLASNSQGNGPVSESSNVVTPSAVPLPVGDLVAWADDASALVRWSNPTTTYGQELTAYVVSDGNGHTCATVNTSCVVTGLSNGESYQFTVIAYYESGISVSSTLSNSVGLPGKPKPIIGVRSVAGDGSLAVSWTAVRTAGARYVVVADDGTSCATTSTSCTLLGLEDGTAYTYAVYASIPDGSFWSSIDYTGTPVAAVPDAPTDVSISAGDGQIVVSWNRPDANGSPILSYTAADNLGHSCVTTETYCVITAMPNGQSASITVRAKNSVGFSVRSQSVSATPMAVPGAPKNLLADPGDGQVLVTWQAPDDVGSDVSYAVVGTGGSSPIYCITTATSCVITGLLNGTSYQFAVTTRTANGVSVATSVTNRVSPATVPSAPLIQNTIASSGSVVVTFTTPTDDGGSPILGHLVVSSLGDECRTTSNMCRFDDLANGQPLTFTVVAENAIGASDASAVSAVVTPRGVADSPQNVLALAGDGLVKISWQAPLNNGGSAILRYTVRDQDGHACTTAVRPVCTIDGLTNGVTYTFSVIAVNGVGNSVATSVTATPTTAPSVPTDVSATVKNTTVTIRWTASKGWGRDVSYIVSDGTGFECRTKSTSCQITGLSYGDRRTFTVVAASDAGVSATSVPSNSVTPAAAPAAPGSLQAVAGKQLVVLSWAAATANGAAITQYLVSDGAGHTCSTTALTCTVTGLTGGMAYTFKVNATNSVGDSPWSKTATATPAAPPSAPLLTLLTPGDAKFLVNFEPPAGNGSAVSAYYYSFDGGVSKVLADWIAGKKFFTVSGLTNGTNYSFQMAASNAAGLGVWTTATAVTPLTTPGAPTLTTAIASTNSIALTFQAPTTTGGSPITSYLYSLDGGTTWSPRPSGTTSLSFTISGLASKKTYRVALRAVNKAGSGSISKVMSVTTR